jgi:hypothetical protein
MTRYKVLFYSSRASRIVTLRILCVWKSNDSVMQLCLNVYIIALF